MVGCTLYIHQCYNYRHQESQYLILHINVYLILHFNTSTSYYTILVSFCLRQPPLVRWTWVVEGEEVKKRSNLLVAALARLLSLLSPLSLRPHSPHPHPREPHTHTHTHTIHHSYTVHIYYGIGTLVLTHHSHTCGIKAPGLSPCCYIRVP